MNLRQLSTFVLINCTIILSAQDESKQRTLEIYGYVMTDIGYNFGQTDPAWVDVLRTSKLPAYKDQWGTDGNVYFSVRQTMFGIKSFNRTTLGELKTIFEFDLFGM